MTVRGCARLFPKAGWIEEGETVRWVVFPVLMMVLAGCASDGRGVHRVPITRDYDRLPETDEAQVAALIQKARALAAQYHAPYAFRSAERYYALARAEDETGDRAGYRDYLALAKRMAETALATTPTAGPGAEVDALRGVKACRAAFTRLEAAFRSLDETTAIRVAPITYADLTADLSIAEHDLRGGAWQKAAEALARVEGALRSITTGDMDEDGVPDMTDAAPWDAEDVDGFEDEDGAPDPDNDRDGVPDVSDAAPLAPETVNGWHDADGAPDTLPVLEPIQFPRDGAMLTATGEAYLAGVGLLLLEWPELTIRVRGHAHSARPEQEDLDLARSRSEAAQRFLESRGVLSKQLIVTYHGGAAPAGGRASNHCVELEFE